jgi:hypothetical protein
MNDIRHSDIFLNRQLDLLINNYVKSTRLKNEMKKWLYVQQLEFDENTSFLLSIYSDHLGESLQIKIDGKFKTYDTVRLIYQRNVHNNDYIQYIIFENDKIQIKMDFKSTYPFTPPSKIYINGEDYILLLKCQSRDLKQLGLGENCLCCSSITCRNNWYPCSNIGDLLEEIEKNLSIKRGISDLIHCNIIKKKYLIDDIPLIEYLFDIK